MYSTTNCIFAIMFFSRQSENRYFLTNFNVSALLLLISLSGCSSGLSFFRLSGPEKSWVLQHPFAAIPAHSITLEARNKSKEMEHDPRLDKDPDGGQVDAFRHSYWMARLTQRLNAKKAFSLGVAHEKGNKKYFDKKIKREEASLEDSISSAMDAYNNLKGIDTGNKFPKISPDSLSNILIEMIGTGKMKVILKSATGSILDCTGHPLDTANYLHHWNNPKCLVNSDKGKIK